MKSKKWAIISGTTCIALFLVMLGMPLLAAGAKEKAEPAKIGCILPMTGPLADAGAKAKQGIELRFDEAGWKVAGRPIQTIYQDSATNPAINLEKAKKLVEGDKVHMLIGGIILEFCIPYTARVKIPQIGVRPIIPEKGMELVYTLMPDGTFKMYVYPMAWYAYDILGYRTATLISHERKDGKEQIHYVHK